MRRFENPVLREGIRIYFRDGHGFGAYASCLIILALIQVSGILLPSFGSKGWLGIAYLFRISFTVAAVLTVYFSLRSANREFAPESFRTFTDWFRRNDVGLNQACLGQAALLSVNILVLVLVCFPALAWAGAIGRVRVLPVLSAPFFLFFYAFTYGVWGLVTAALWEESPERRQILLRCAVVSWLMLSTFLYLPLNPAAFFLFQFRPDEFGSTGMLAKLTWRAPAIHFLYHVLLLGGGFLTYREVLKRRAAFVSR